MKAKDAGLRIRIDRELRDAFVAACREQDMPAAQVLREFMRLYVEEHTVGAPKARWHSGRPAVAAKKIL
jgi:hypothetical protein